jgi:hypothetical protein
MSVQIALLITNIILVSPALAGVLPEGGPFEWAVIFTSAAGGAGQMVMVSPYQLLADDRPKTLAPPKSTPSV